MLGYFDLVKLFTILLNQSNPTSENYYHGVLLNEVLF